MKHSHYVWNGFMNFTIVLITIMSSATMHQAIVTDGLIVCVHYSNRGLCLSRRESLLGQERPEWFVFGKKGLSLGAAGAVTRVVSFLPTSPAFNFTGIFPGRGRGGPCSGFECHAGRTRGRLIERA